MSKYFKMDDQETDFLDVCIMEVNIGFAFLSKNGSMKTELSSSKINDK